MTGLRARQKADRNHRILAAATALFRDQGYHRTKLETISGHAGISVGTVYNYYENKGDLLMAIVSMEVNEVLNAGVALVTAPPDDVETAINALMGIYLDHSLHYLSKEMWREAMAITTRQPETEFGRAYLDLDERLLRQICDLIRHLQSVRRIRPDIDTEAVGEMFFNNMNMMFTVFVRDEAMDLARLKSAIARQNRTLAAAIAA